MHLKLPTKKDVRRRTAIRRIFRNSAFVRNQVGSGPDADAAPELNKALHPVFAISERPGSVYADFTSSGYIRLTYPCLRLRHEA